MEATLTPTLSRTRERGKNARFVVSGAALKSHDESVLLPDLLALTGGALAAAETLLCAAKRAAAALVAPAGDRRRRPPRAAADRRARLRLDGDLCRGAAPDARMGGAARRGRRARRGRGADPARSASANIWRSSPAASRWRRARSRGRRISASTDGEIAPLRAGEAATLVAGARPTRAPALARAARRRHRRRRFGRSRSATRRSSMIRDQVRRFAERAVAPYAHDWHRARPADPDRGHRRSWPASASSA